jgi:hypothetical protein
VQYVHPNVAPDPTGCIAAAVKIIKANFVKMYDEPHLLVVPSKRRYDEPGSKDVHQRAWRVHERELYQELSRYYRQEGGMWSRPKLLCKCKGGVLDALVTFYLPAFFSVLEDLERYPDLR